jgi:hypothetical protein
MLSAPGELIKVHARKKPPPIWRAQRTLRPATGAAGTAARGVPEGPVPWET